MQAIGSSALGSVAAAAALASASLVSRATPPAAPVATPPGAHIEPWHHDRPIFAVLVVTLAAHADAHCHTGFGPTGEAIPLKLRDGPDDLLGGRLPKVIETGTLPAPREGFHSHLYGGCEASVDPRYWECSVRGVSFDQDGMFGDGVFVRIRTSDGSLDLDTIRC